MAIFDGKDLIRFHAHSRKVIRNIKERHGITIGLFEILCASYDQQEINGGFFFSSQLRERLPTIGVQNLYRSLRKLIEANCLSCSLRTDSGRGNFYIVTGTGESVLRDYVRQLRELEN